MVMREVLTLLQHLHMHLNYLFHYIIFHLVPYICHACRRVFFAGTFLSTVDWCNTEKKALQPNESRFCFCLSGTHLGSSIFLEIIFHCYDLLSWTYLDMVFWNPFFGFALWLCKTNKTSRCRCAAQRVPWTSVPLNRFWGYSCCNGVVF